MKYLSGLLIFASMLLAQGRVELLNGEVVVCKQIEITDTHIIFIPAESIGDQPLQISKNTVKKVIFTDGSVAYDRSALIPPQQHTATDSVAQVQSASSASDLIEGAPEPQVVSDNSTINTSASSKYKIAPIFGLDFLAESDLPADLEIYGNSIGMGIGAKVGIRYSNPANHIQLEGLLGYNYVGSREWKTGWDQTERTTTIRSLSRKLLQVRISYTKGEFQPYILFGVGSGNFEKKRRGEITKSHQRIWGYGGGNMKSHKNIWMYGGGIQIENIVFGMVYFGPQVELYRESSGYSEVMNNGIQFNLGILGNIPFITPY
jgi:hypothetical protein